MTSYAGSAYSAMYAGVLALVQFNKDTEKCLESSLNVPLEIIKVIMS